ncbi:MAG: GGDEF domain-containing protein [Enterobacterales bacterium]|nr:GGDEF domain-containing protein [Enterobacterales bacterium]
MPHVSEILAEKVSSALLIMRATDQAALQAQIMGWTIPKNYREVDYAYSQLKIGFYKNLANYSIFDVLVRYWKYFLIALLTFTSMVTTTLYIISLNRKLKDSREKLRLQATHDALTGLPNRILFFELANKYLKIAGREQQDSMILFLDLDKFKQINDIHGHDAGDQLLKDTASRIANCLRDTDIVARIGGDEFLIMLANVNTMDSFKTIMQRIISATSMPFVSPTGDSLQIGCSIGASHYPRQGEHLTELIKKADLALYQAKNNGRGNFVVFKEDQAA